MQLKYKQVLRNVALELQTQGTGCPGRESGHICNLDNVFPSDGQNKTDQELGNYLILSLLVYGSVL